MAECTLASVLCTPCRYIDGLAMHRDRSLLDLMQLAMLQAQLPAGDRGRFGIVRHHQQRHAELLVEPLQQPQNLHRRVVVEIAGRLVGDDDLRDG